MPVLRLSALYSVLSLSLTAGWSGAADSLKEKPEARTAAEAGVGRLLADAEFTDLAGTAHSISALAAAAPVTVLAFTGSTCPLCLRLAPTLAALEDEWKEKGVRFIFIDPLPSDTPDSLRKLAADHGLDGPMVHDAQRTLATSLGAASTTEVFVFDGARTLLYRGAVDDQYGIGYQQDAPREKYLEDALKAITSGSRPRFAATTAPGCALDLGPAQPQSGDVTWHNQVSRIMQNHCQECHRPGGVGPFELMTHADAVSHAGMIRKVVDKGIMPPWFAAAPEAGSHSPWLNDRSLSAEDRTALLAWLQSDKPEGNPADAPKPRQWPQEWTIGTPDAVLEMPRAIDIKATGRMAYIHEKIETDFPEDRWVQGLEVLPSARAQTHHVLVFVIPPGEKAPKGGEGDDFFAAYVPGSTGVVYPDGFAKRLPKGSTLLFQLHYTPNGTAAADRTRLAMKFAKGPPEHEVRVAGAKNTKFAIPPGAGNHEEKAMLPVPVDATVLAFMPHMHMRGKSFRYELALPDGARRTVLDVPRYDFNWQLLYRLAEPLFCPKGSRLEVSAAFDNSPENPANPDPKRTVKWGPQTEDEMLIGYVEYYLPSASPAAGTGPELALTQRTLGPLAKRLDTDHDQRISKEEAGERYSALHSRLDVNKDGYVTRDEVAGLLRRRD